MTTDLAEVRAAAFTTLGCKWSLSILWMILVKEQHTFTALHRATGAPRSVLTTRLDELVTAGVLERRPYRVSGTRSRDAYHATPHTRTLQAPLAAIGRWEAERSARPNAAEQQRDTTP
jgi:DNA-binding HxlR family transcriptional regulator